MVTSSSGGTPKIAISGKGLIEIPRMSEIDFKKECQFRQFRAYPVHVCQVAGRLRASVTSYSSPVGIKFKEFVSTIV